MQLRAPGRGVGGLAPCACYGWACTHSPPDPWSWPSWLSCPWPPRTLMPRGARPFWPPAGSSLFIRPFVCPDSSGWAGHQAGQCPDAPTCPVAFLCPPQPRQGDRGNSSGLARPDPPPASGEWAHTHRRNLGRARAQERRPARPLPRGQARPRFVPHRPRGTVQLDPVPEPCRPARGGRRDQPIACLGLEAESLYSWGN